MKIKIVEENLYAVLLINLIKKHPFHNVNKLTTESQFQSDIIYIAT